MNKKSEMLRTITSVDCENQRSYDPFRTGSVPVLVLPWKDGSIQPHPSEQHYVPCGQHLLVAFEASVDGIAGKLCVILLTLSKRDICAGPHYSTLYNQQNGMTRLSYIHDVFTFFV